MHVHPSTRAYNLADDAAFPMAEQPRAISSPMMKTDGHGFRSSPANENRPADIAGQTLEAD